MASDTPITGHTETFAKQDRLTKRREFLSVYGQRRAYFFRYVVIYVKANEGSGHRLGITVSKKAGCSVLRNRVKRVVREAFRKSKGLIPESYDIVVNAKKDARQIGLSDAIEALNGLASKVGL
jgi:ribonuclease P protein component